MNTGFKVGMLVMGVLLLFCCGGFMLTLSPVTATVEKREKEAKGFGDNYTRQILRNWSADQLVSLATETYKKEFSKEQFQKSLDGNKKALGAYVSGRGTARLRKTDKTSIVCAYEQRATFANGKARVKMDLVYADKKWSIDQFAIEPD